MRDRYPTGGPPPSASTPLHPGWRARLLVLRARMRSTRLGRLAFSVFIAMFGALVVIVGLVLIPFPGPGWLIVAAGVGIWALEFHWARRLLGVIRRTLRTWTRWIGTLPPAVRAVLGLVTAAVIVAVGWASLRNGLGIDLAERLWR